MLAELIRKGIYNPLDLKSASAEKLQEVCSLVGIPVRKANTTKVCLYSYYIHDCMNFMYFIFSLKWLNILRHYTLT